MFEIQQNTSTPVETINKNNINVSEADTIAKGEARSVSDFEKIAGAHFATPPGPQIAPAPQQAKRKRGRPRKQKRQNNQTAAAYGENTAAVSDLGQASEQKKPEAADFKPFLSPILLSVSKIPATKYKNKNLELTKDETEQIAGALNDVINIYLPDLEKMDPKSAALLTLAVTIGSIAITKLQAMEVTQTQVELAPAAAV